MTPFLQSTLLFFRRYSIGMLLAAWLAWLGYASAQSHQGQFSYALDDAYIHMGIAKNLASHGVWGIGQQFASASSSILWPIVLALCFAVFGQIVWLPYALNLAGVLYLAWWMQHWTSRLRRNGRPPQAWLSGIATVLVCGAAAVPTLALTGLEHVWHLVSLVSAVHVIAHSLAQESGDQAAVRRAIFAAPWLTLMRYETLALIPVFVALALLRRRFRLALGIALAGCAPVVLFGLWSTSQGGHFFPNSLILKAALPTASLGFVENLSATIIRATTAIRHQPGILWMFHATWILCLYDVVRSKTLFRRETLIGLAFLAATIAHAGFGSFGWLFRYEGYLYGFGMYTLIHFAYARWSQPYPEVAASVRVPWRIVTIGISVAVSLMALRLTYKSGQRTYYATTTAFQATKNIYEQQVQFGKFLAKYYQHDSVLLNDIGTTAFYADGKIIDLVGLASLEVIELKRSGQFDQASFERLAQEGNAKLAIVYDEWFAFAGGLPPNWQRVEQWEITGNVICGSSRVSFYGLNPQAATELARNLSDFADELPPDVTRIVSAI